MSAKLGLCLRACALVGLVILLVFIFVFPNSEHVSAAAVNLQTTPGYDPPTDEPPTTNTTPGYDSPETDTPATNVAGTNIPTTNATTITPTTAGTVTETTTPGPNMLGTEDAEMNDAQTTPQFTATAEPTITPYYTPSPTRTKTQLPARTPAAAKKNSGFIPDWGMFWIGFSLPVLGICGVVLYLLDRRPDLFKRR